MAACLSLVSGCLTEATSTADTAYETVTSTADIAYGSVTLSWTAPTQNEDGSVLTDLDGYRLYWGQTAGRYTNSVTIDNESITIYILDAPVGTYEIVATSFNTSGVESRYSNPATIVVQ